LWDGYFFSTLPPAVPASSQPGLVTSQAGDPDYHLPNARHVFYWKDGSANNAEVTELKDANKAAAHLLVNGGFNINSTSTEAWRALLYSHNGVDTDPADPTNKKHPYSRFSIPVAGAQPNASWLGYRILSDAQIDALAAAIVTEIHNRGPFLSLADFVNRRLAADATGLKGPLQAAIDATSGAGSVNGVSPFTDTSAQITTYSPDINSDTEQKTIYMGGTDATQPSASRAAFAPGYLTQADLLAALGPSLTARSDTFRIRTYGDVVNPSTGGTTPVARAWCEAIVQRLPDYMDSATDSNAYATPTAAVNIAMGRRFKIISFRWLSSNEI